MVDPIAAACVGQYPTGRNSVGSAIDEGQLASVRKTGCGVHANPHRPRNCRSRKQQTPGGASQRKLSAIDAMKCYSLSVQKQRTQTPSHREPAITICIVDLYTIVVSFVLPAHFPRPSRSHSIPPRERAGTNPKTPEALLYRFSLSTSNHRAPGFPIAEGFHMACFFGFAILSSDRTSLHVHR